MPTALRRRIHDVLDPNGRSRAARTIRVIQILLVIAGLVLAALSTEPTVPVEADMLRLPFAALVVVFAAEYGLRLWTAVEAPGHAARSDRAVRWRWAVSPTGLIDAACLLPIIPILLQPDPATMLQTAAGGIEMIWVLKLVRYVPGATALGRVLRNERHTLGGVLLMFIAAVVIAATLAHLAEGAAQPERFGSIPRALWWAVTTMTTTGYGDAVPVTPLGRMLGSAVMVSGIMVLALLAGILATGFADEIRRRDFVRIWSLVAQVPFLRSAGAAVIGEIARALRQKEVPAGGTIIRRGEVGDCMYFIVRGEVEVRLPEPVTLAEGSFFGEVALLQDGRRTATVVARTACSLLVLDVADFRYLAGQRPDLAEAITEEGRRRGARTAH
ncbi:cyclic nucleotide-gated ion channel [Inquilinus sp. YAF38]|uniref:cyclic nucleotide-gated ion channel n=1 Tax=Inquilinus sp. YAF38 TaxID=3233084 RepID=UPI003F93595C